ncbi:MAG: phytanoyl-CoA dioxygenase family protein [Planctomycetes bacterium]|nr:phytanoyl-CoA dioxygenase family protein [Planctomycetota bacterium]
MPSPAPRSATPSSVGPVITAEQVRSFVDDGFLVVPDLVSPLDVQRLRDDAAALARGKYPCKSLEPMPADYSDLQVLERLLCIHQPHNISPVIREFVFHAGIVAVLSRIIGAHLAHWNGAVKCMQSMLFIKPPGKPGQAWHQDEIYIPTRDRSLCGAWIALDDATEANGCLRVIPGSHRSGYLYPNRAHDDNEEFDFAPESHGFDASQEILVQAKAGSVVFFNGYLLHRSKRNRSQVYRRALVSHYMSMNSLLPWGVEGRIAKEGLAVAGADCRAVMPVCGEDPYAWKGYDPLGDNVWLRSSAQST